MTFDTNITLINSMFRQFEIGIIKLAWDSFTTNTLFDDLFIDDLSSHSGINGSLSYYQYDPSRKLVYKPTGVNLRVVTNAWSASQNNPISAYCILEIYPPYTYTINTDIKVYISTNGGTNFEQFTNLYQLFSFQAISNVFLKGEISSLTARNTNQIVLKIETFNSIDIKVSAFSVGTRY